MKNTRTVRFKENLTLTCLEPLKELNTTFFKSILKELTYARINNALKWNRMSRRCFYKTLESAEPLL